LGFESGFNEQNRPALYWAVRFSDTTELLSSEVAMTVRAKLAEVGAAQNAPV